MSELRAPDPTLSELEGWAVVDDTTAPLPVAHAFIGHRAPPVCGALLPVGKTVLMGNARWFAIPCRACFPDAPKPGWRHCRMGSDCVHDPCPGEWTSHLSWQTGGEV